MYNRIAAIIYTQHYNDVSRFMSPCTPLHAFTKINTLNRCIDVCILLYINVRSVETNEYNNIISYVTPPPPFRGRIRHRIYVPERQTWKYKEKKMCI